MKIALGIFVYFPYGGLQRDMLDIARELQSRGHQAVIITGHWRSGAKPDGVEVRELPLAGLSNHARARAFARKFLAESSDADVRLTFNRFGGCHFYFAGDICFKAELQNTRLAFLKKQLPRYRTFLAQEQEVFAPGGAGKILYISRQQKEQFRSCYGTEEERFIPLPPGIGSGFTPPGAGVAERMRLELGIDPGKKVLAFAAVNWLLKGGDRVLEAFRKLPAEVRGKYHILFIGGDHRGKAKSLVSKYGLEANCSFAGMVDCTARYLQAADILLHPARKEAAGNVIAEALGCGVPVLCTALCGFSDLVGESGAGRILDDQDCTRELHELLNSGLPDLSVWQSAALRSAGTLPLRNRAARVADVLEEFGKCP